MLSFAITQNDSNALRHHDYCTNNGWHEPFARADVRYSTCRMSEQHAEHTLSAVEPVRTPQPMCGTQRAAAIALWLNPPAPVRTWVHPLQHPPNLGHPFNRLHPAGRSSRPTTSGLLDEHMAPEPGICWGVPRPACALLPAQVRLRPPHRRIGEARRPGPAGASRARILVANATTLEASWPAIRLEPWDCLLVQESRMPALSWLRTELRQKGWRYLSGATGADGRDLVSIMIK